MSVASEKVADLSRPLKGKSVRRTIEVLEFMAQHRAGVTVMDVTRALGIPQSTTSELLGALVDLGVAARDTTSRYYSATPRLAAIGLAAQSPRLADARFFETMGGFARRTGLLIGLFGMNDASIQPYWVSGVAGDKGASQGEIDPGALFRNSTTHLASGAVGLVLLSSLSHDRSSRLLWRIRSEVGEHEKFSHGDLCNSVQSIRERGSASGASGFGMALGATAVMLPSAYGPQPLALAAFYPRASFIDTDALAQAMLQELDGSLGSRDDRADFGSYGRSVQAVPHLSLVHSG